MFLQIIASCFPPTKAKKQKYKLHMMIQNYIESHPPIAHALIEKDIDFQTLEHENDNYNKVDIQALRFKKWFTRHWDIGINEKLPENIEKKILSMVD